MTADGPTNFAYTLFLFVTGISYPAIKAMARENTDREDLLREATALVERIELSLTTSTTTPGAGEPVVVGFRGNGCGSVFFGQDLAYHFNSSNQLRRVFDHGTLFKAVSGRLASLSRQLEDGQVQLLRHDLTDAEINTAIDRWERQRQALRSALSAGQFRVAGQVPREADVLSRVIQWLETVARPAIADAPGAK